MTKIGTNVKVAAAPAVTLPQYQQKPDPQYEQKVPGGLMYIKNLRRNRRANLALGEHVQFVNQNGDPIMHNGKPVQMLVILFKAVSAQHDLLEGDKVAIPECISPTAVAYVVEKIMQLPTAAKVSQFNRFPIYDENGKVNEAAYDPFKDILTCSAADALGMSSFTQGIFNHYFRVLNTEQPDYTLMTTVTTIRTPTGEKLFKQMAYNIATKLFERTFIDVEKFEKGYCPKNPRLEAEVCGLLEKFHAKEIRQTNFKAKRERRIREEKEVADRAAKQTARRVAKDAEWKAAGDSYRQKVQTGNKDFTAMEVRYAWNKLSVHVPASGGG